MNNQLVPFQFNTSLLRTLLVNDVPLFIAKDVAEALGYEKPSNAISKHCKKAKSLKELGYPVLGTDELMAVFGTTSIVVIPESDVYRLAMRSKLESAEKFQDWIVEDVLPSIRKTGSYSIEADKPKLPITYLEALKELVAKEELILEQAKVIEVLEPKAKAIDKLRSIDGCVVISEAAKIVGVKRDEFFSMLNEAKWIFKRSGIWLGYEPARCKGLVDHRPVEANGQIRTQCVITPKGLTEIALMIDSGMAL